MRNVSEKPCSIEGCSQPFYAKEYCRLHWNRQRVHGDPGPVDIITKGTSVFGQSRDCAQCGDTYKSYGKNVRCGPCSKNPKCVTCNKDWKWSNLECSVCYRNRFAKQCSDCGDKIGPYAYSGKCQRCASFGPLSRTVGTGGYIILHGIRDYPIRSRNGVREHHYIYWKATGHVCDTKNGESIHHINGIRDDNRIENLELWTRSQPSGQRVSDKVLWAVEILERYAPEKLHGKSKRK